MHLQKKRWRLAMEDNLYTNKLISPMEFVTTDGKLTIANNIIQQSRVTKERRQGILFSVLVFILFLKLFIRDIEDLIDTGKKLNWIGIIGWGAFLLNYIIYWLIILFR